MNIISCLSFDEWFKYIENLKIKKPFRIDGWVNLYIYINNIKLIKKKAI
jgi:hypothetical protein